MITAAELLEPARTAGFDFYTGVPCSYLTPLINGVASDPTLGYLPAANEGEAVAIAAGAWLAGRQPVVMMQNSGLGNAVSPLTSLNAPFRIPALLVVTWRGRPGEPDEPQHAVMGPITPALLALIGVEHAMFPAERAGVAAILARAGVEQAARRMFALVMPKGSVADTALAEPTRVAPAHGAVHDLDRRGPRPARAELLEAVLAAAPAHAAILSTTGKTSRELFTLADRPAHFYLVGSMGCAGAVGLGVALGIDERSEVPRGIDRPVVVLDGDGAALMRLETLATIAANRPRRLIHVILDNGVHDSTGGQATAAALDFAAVAAAAGYVRSFRVDSVAGFAEAFAAAIDPRGGAGPQLIHARISPGSMAALGRPTIAPHEVASRFRRFLCEPH